MLDDGRAYVRRLLEDNGPLTLDEIRAAPNGKYGFKEWSPYLERALQFCIEHAEIEEGEDERYDVTEFYRVPPPPKMVDPNRQYYCKKCFYVLRKLVFMRTMGDTGLHMCPDCGDVDKMEWMEARAYCDIFMRHYRKLKQQVEEEMELEDDDDK